MSDDVSEFLDIFRDEANERLDTMVASLLQLETGQGGADAIDELFRAAHTIKGGAGMLGLDDVRTVAHAVEDILDEVRESGTFPPDLTDVLLRAVDVMRRQLTGEAEGAPDLLDELAARRHGVTGGVPQPAPAPEPGPEARVGAAPEPAAERRAIRVPAEKIDRLLDLVGESVLHQRRLEHVLGDERASFEIEVSDELDHGERLLEDLKDTAIAMRTLPLGTITGALPRAVRDIALAEGKQVDLHIKGSDTELDRVILEGLHDPLVHIIRNAIAHGIEPADERERAGKPRSGTIELRAVQRGGTVEIVVADDGRGVSRELLEQARTLGSLVDVLARAGFSTADEVTELSGRGVGLDAVKRHVETFGGTMELESVPGQGTEVVLHLPLALALLEVLMVHRGGRVYGIPLASVEEVVGTGQSLSLEGKPALELRGRTLSIVDLADQIGAHAPAVATLAPAIVVVAGGRRVAVQCDRLLGEDEIVVKPLGPLLARVSGYLGGAILRDGRVALLIDPNTLLRRARSTASTSVATTSTPTSPRCATPAPRSSRSRPISSGGRATLPCVTRPGT